jgi:hypothetical protein
MVLVCGYVIDKKALPFADVIEYNIKASLKDIKMLKYTKLEERSSAIYVTSEYVSYIDKKYRDKTCIVDDIDQLKNLLVTGQIIHNCETATNNAHVRAETLNIKRKRAVKRIPAKSVLLETEKDALNTSALEMVTETDTDTDTETLKQQIENLQIEKRNLEIELQQVQVQVRQYTEDIAIINAQVDDQEALIKDLNTQNAQLQGDCEQYSTEVKKLQTDVATLQDLCNSDDRNKRIEELEFDKAQLEVKVEDLTTATAKAEMLLQTERIQFERDKQTYQDSIEQLEKERKTGVVADILATYANPNKRILINPQLHITPELEKGLARAIIISSGSAIKTVLSGVKNSIETLDDSLIVDLTGDRYLNLNLNLNNEQGTYLQILNSSSVSEIKLQKRKNTEIIITENINDIALIKMDWTNLLLKLSEIADGRPIYIIMGEIKSFIVLYTAIMLSSIMPMYIAVNAEPTDIFNLYWQINKIPKERVKLLFYNYKGANKNLLDKFVDNYTVELQTSNLQLSEKLLKHK